ncbi:MAG: uracil-DNA glycosylase [Deltaproteobacteria bacterium]|nr:uracil-DNA glycosylase [Deltaproteobacteria bacterium]MBW1956475.1 uracil-DNA glycosylase [Deltaproteobacteria bacterium]MBW2042816.1 uracil-DNA glycosylase [Deltaproteobacteria bacterium]MBW2133434.1 uracil-DNA glycosylase [Deltaproteobacteria bacterium]
MATEPLFQEVLQIVDAAVLTLRRLSRSGQTGFDCNEKTRNVLKGWGKGVSAGETLEDIRTDLGDCQRCGLNAGRTRIVFGAGDPDARLVFVGEGPGYEEDRQGEPFVGAAGRLLTKIIGAMGLTRDRVYICNVVKCRPPGNRNPLPDEMDQCLPFLKRQIKSIQPRVICALGSVAAHALLGTEAPISRLRGRFHDWEGIPLMPSYHPAYLLRNPEKKRDVWEDMKQIMALLDGSRNAG